MNHYEEAVRSYEHSKLANLNTLIDLLKIKTISSDSNYKNEMEKGAQWICDYLKRLGAINIRVFSTNTFPIVFGEIRSSILDAPSILVYGHYDVQPPDPLDLWECNPFSPEIRNGNLYARGSSDMKGQLMVVLNAIKAISDTTDFPINITFLVEGEEEIGSPSIKDFLKENKDLFKCDFVLNLDAGMISKDKPTIVYGLRGIAYFEIYIYGPSQDLHSGIFGGVVYNPIQAICEIISGMKDDQGIIQLPNFYDDVIPLSAEEKHSLSQLGIDDNFYKNQTGVKVLFGEKGYSSIERVGARPTLDINGIFGGYTGEGPKTVIPAKVMAKLSMRLVPNQTPEKVKMQLIEYLQKNAPKEIEWEIKELSSDAACLTDKNYFAVKCFADSLNEVWGKTPVYQRGGGSIPIVSHMKKILNLESVLSGFSLPEDNIHSPNEKLNLEIFDKGVATIIHFIFHLSEVCKNG